MAAFSPRRHLPLTAASLFMTAVISSDYAAVQGFVLAMALLYVLLNLLIDLLTTAIDPRVRFES